MEDVFEKKLAGKTRVIVTHYLHILDKVDKVLLLDEGKIVVYGTFDEVKRTREFKEFSNMNTESIIEEQREPGDLDNLDNKDMSIEELEIEMVKEEINEKEEKEFQLKMKEKIDFQIETWEK